MWFACPLVFVFVSVRTLPRFLITISMSVMVLPKRGTVNGPSHADVLYVCCCKRTLFVFYVFFFLLGVCAYVWCWPFSIVLPNFVPCLVFRMLLLLLLTVGLCVKCAAVCLILRCWVLCVCVVSVCLSVYVFVLSVFCLSVCVLSVLSVCVLFCPWFRFAYCVLFMDVLVLLRYIVAWLAACTLFVVCCFTAAFGRNALLCCICVLVGVHCLPTIDMFVLIGAVSVYFFRACFTSCLPICW